MKAVHNSGRIPHDQPRDCAGPAETLSPEEIARDVAYGRAVFKAMLARMDETDAALIYSQDGRYIMVRLSKENAISPHLVAHMPKESIARIIQTTLLQQFGMVDFRSNPVCEAPT